MSIKVRSLFLLCLIPFPLLALEFLDLSVIAPIIAMIVMGFWQNKTKYFIFLLSALVIYNLKQSFGAFYLPEPMITFLGTACLLRIIFTKSSSDKVSRTLGFLWIAAFSLFKTDILYFLIMIYSISFIFLTLDKKDDEPTHPIKFLALSSIGGIESIISLSLIGLLFVFFPRFSGFFPRRNSQPQGKIGYSKNVDNSTMLSLQSSSQTAFIARTDRQLASDQLYWRGRILSYTDGFNWRKGKLKPTTTIVKVKNPIVYQVKYEIDLEKDIILLESPYKIESSNMGQYKDNTTNTFSFYNKGRKAIVNAISSLDGKHREKYARNKDAYTQLPSFIPSDLKNFVKEHKLNGKNFDFVIRKLKSYLIVNKFSYSLSPGDSTTLAKFLNRKIGYCTHYASFAGILFRYLKFPTRLVSGFQGGIYNDLGGYYTVSSNDAHAWIEVLVDNKWIKVDPTGFIDPSRINLGGQTYFNSSSSEFITGNNRESNILLKAKMIWSYVNYRASLFLDNYDMEKQDSFSKSLNITKKMFYLIGVFLIIIFCFFYFLKRTDKRIIKPLIDRQLEKYFKKLNISILPTDSLSEIKEKAGNNNQAIEVINQYEQIKYAGKSDGKEIKKFRQLLKKITTNKV